MLCVYGFFTVLRLGYATEFGGITDNFSTFDVAAIGQTCFVYFFLELLVELYAFRTQMFLAPMPHIILSVVVLAADLVLLSDVFNISEENEMMVLGVRGCILFKMACGVTGKVSPPYLLSKSKAWCVKGTQVPQKRLMKEGAKKKGSAEPAVEGEGGKTQGGKLIQIGPTNQPTGEASFIVQALRHEWGWSTHVLQPPKRSRYILVRLLRRALYNCHRFCRDVLVILYDRGIELHFTRGEVEEDNDDEEGGDSGDGGHGTRTGCRSTAVYLLEKLCMVLLILLMWFFGLVSLMVFAGWGMAVGLDSPKLLDHLVHAALLQPLRSQLLVNDFGSAGGGDNNEGDEKAYEFEAVGILTTSIPACLLCYMLMVLYDVLRTKVEPTRFSLRFSHRELHALHMERIRQFEPGERVKVLNKAYMRGGESMWTEQLRREYKIGVNGRQYYRAVVKERIEDSKKNHGMYRVVYSDSSFESGFKRETKVHRRMLMARDRWKWELTFAHTGGNSKEEPKEELEQYQAEGGVEGGEALVTKGGEAVHEFEQGMLPVIKRPTHGPGKEYDNATRRYASPRRTSIRAPYMYSFCTPSHGPIQFPRKHSRLLRREAV
jgi:hypothetical protein